MGLIANIKLSKLITLQNILFKTNEKKMQVSKEFLETVTQNFVNNRMKIVNDCIESVYSTKTPKVFFNNYDIAVNTLDELIVMEEFFDFKYPVPSDYKRRFEEKKSDNIDCMIGRLWRLTQHSNSPDGNSDGNEKFKNAVNRLLVYRDKMTEQNISTINELHISIFGCGIDGNPPPDDKSNSEPTET